MKKIIALLLAALMLVGFAACSDGDEPAQSSDPSATSSEEAVNELPSVVGKTAEEAVAAISAAGYTNVKTVYAHKDGVAKDVVIAQSKTADAVYDADALILLQISNGLSAEDSAKTPIEDPLLAGRETLSAGANADYQPLNYDNIKGIWLSQLDLIPAYYDYDNEVQRTEDDYVAKIDKIMSNIKDCGFNTVFVQVHPDCDSMYVSSLYPWSDYLNGNSNRNQNQVLLSDDAKVLADRSYGNTSLYDPMPIMIEAAHKYGLSFQAWINPMRGYALDEVAYVNDSYTIKQWYNDEEKSSTYLFQTKTRLYLNPAYEEVRQYIVDVAVEICRYYDVDGIHLDDYFYPDNNTQYDKTAFNAQKDSEDGFDNVLAFRRNNVNLLVKALHDAVKAENKDMLFGISPGGNIQTNMTSLCADVETWCSTDGYIDYIMPQIYWGFDHATAAFDAMCDKWITLTTAESVDVIIGTCMHKIGKEDTYAGEDGKTEWIDKDDILKRSFEWIERNKEYVDGTCVFSYQYLFDVLTGEQVEYTKAQADNYLPVMQALAW